MPINYYAILGIAPTASAEEVRISFRKAALAAHPDRGGSNHIMQRINEAWAVLGDSQKRQAYDARRLASRSPASSPKRDASRPPKSPGARPRPATGPRPPTFAQIAGTLFGKAVRAIGGWMDPAPKSARKPASARGMVIVRCCRCGQKLRLKKSRPDRIRCPKCRTLQVLK
jgi:curved DNA-binding protein CbpA